MGQRDECRLDVVLLLEELDVFGGGCTGLGLLLGLVLLEVKDDQVAAPHIEAGEMVDSVLRVVDVLVNHESGTSRVSHSPSTSQLAAVLADLSYGPELPKDVVQLLRRDLVREVAHVYDPVHFGWQSDLNTAMRTLRSPSDANSYCILATY